MGDKEKETPERRTTRRTHVQEHAQPCAQAAIRTHSPNHSQSDTHAPPGSNTRDSVRRPIRFTRVFADSCDPQSSPK